MVHKKWLLRLFALVSFLVVTIGIYFFARFWAHNSASFDAEVNAALITAIVGILTLLATSLVSSYYNRRSLRATIRDEIFRKRIQVYQQLLDYSSDFVRLIYQYIYKPTEKNAEKIRDFEQKIVKFVQQNRFNLSPALFARYNNLTEGVEYLTTSPKTFNRLTKELSLDHVLIIGPKDLADRFHTVYIYPFLEQFKKELGLSKIESELKDLIS